jgi:hypothetical protein
MKYYFDQRDGLPIRDNCGRDFMRPSEAIQHAKYLAADIRAIERDVRPNLSIRVIGESGVTLHEEPVWRPPA